jgi:hypothetical protein
VWGGGGTRVWGCTWQLRAIAVGLQCTHTRTQPGKRSPAPPHGNTDTWEHKRKNKCAAIIGTGTPGTMDGLAQAREQHGGRGTVHHGGKRPNQARTRGRAQPRWRVQGQAGATCPPPPRRTWRRSGQRCGRCNAPPRGPRWGESRGRAPWGLSTWGTSTRQTRAWGSPARPPTRRDAVHRQMNNGAPVVQGIVSNGGGACRELLDFITPYPPPYTP